MNIDTNSKKIDAKRILVIRYRFIGDTILTVPFLRNLRKAYPQARIDMLVGPSSGEVLDGCPYIDSTIEYDTTRFHKYDSGKGKKRSFLSYVFELRKHNYDLVFVLKRSLSSAILALLTGARHRVGYATEGRSLLLTRPVSWNSKIHEVDSLLEVLEAASVPVEGRHLEAWISSDERSRVLSKVSELACPGPKVLIHAAAAHPDKLYPLEFWSEIIDQLHGEFGTTPFFTGARLDKGLYEELAALSTCKSVNMAGELSLRESMALYKEMNLSICVDSGPAHLSAAVGTPTVAIFGPTDPHRWRPFGKNALAIYDETLACRPCHYQKTCDGRPCLTALDPQKIIDACRALLKSQVSTSAAAIILEPGERK